MRKLVTLENTVVTFLGNLPNFKQIWHSKNRKKIIVKIFWKRLIVERNGWNFATRSPRNCIHVCMVLLTSDCWSSFCSYSVHFAKFPIISATPSTVFVWLQQHLCGKYDNFTNLHHFDDKSPQLHCHRHKPTGVLISSGKRPSRVSRRLGLLFQSLDWKNFDKIKQLFADVFPFCCPPILTLIIVIVLTIKVYFTGI